MQPRPHYKFGNQRGVRRRLGSSGNSRVFPKLILIQNQAVENVSQQQADELGMRINLFWGRGRWRSHLGIAGSLGDSQHPLAGVIEAQFAR